MRSQQIAFRSRQSLKAQQAWLLGQQRGRAGKWSEAAKHFHEAKRLSPSDVLFGLNLADALYKCGRLEDSARASREALEVDPQNQIAVALHANALFGLNRYEGLVDLLTPRSVHSLSQELLVMRGVAQVRQGMPREAIQSFIAALGQRPSEAAVHYRLGLAFNELAMKREAAECFKTALMLGLGPLEVGVRDLLAFYEREMCDWRGGSNQVEALRKSILGLPDDAALELNPFAHVTLLDDPNLQLRAARVCSRYFQSVVEPLQTRRPEMRERLRLGYVSADFHRHATSYLMAELFERHDRRRFEVFVYSHGRDDGSTVRERIRSAADCFIEARDMTASRLARRIADDGIDILVDLKGYTQDARPAVFAHRPAPLQVAYLGFPGTTGAKYMDYIIGDSWVTPLDDAACYSERIAQLSGSYQCNDGTRSLPVRPHRSTLGLPERALVLCGFNQPYKISPEVFDVWCRILLRVPNAVLWLLAWNDQAVPALTQEAVMRGIDPARLIFAPSVPQADHLDRLGCADIFLDTWPCNGHTTASDMLWAGVPVVTYSGKTFASRVAGSLLHAVGVPETICGSVEAYEAKVMELATHESIRLDIRDRIERARQTSPLFSGERIARDIEALYERMWDRALAGIPPEHLPALPAPTMNCLMGS
jgi:predicted O-linked N-acetylglucosamine transferase (SPINDLY family)